MRTASAPHHALRRDVLRRVQALAEHVEVLAQAADGDRRAVLERLKAFLADLLRAAGVWARQGSNP